MQSEKSEKKCTTVASLIHSWIAQRRLLCNKTGEKNSRQLFFYIASWSHFFCHGSVNTAKQGGDGFLICCHFSVAVWKHDNRSSGHAFLYVRTARILMYIYTQISMYIYESCCIYTNLDVYTRILMYIYKSWCIYTNLDVYIRILMYIYESWCIYTNLGVYIRILMYISLSYHVNLWSCCFVPF